MHPPACPGYGPSTDDRRGWNFHASRLFPTSAGFRAGVGRLRRTKPSRTPERWDVFMRKLGFAGLLAVALVLTGCGSSGDDGGGGSAIAGDITVLTQRTDIVD